MTQKKDDKNTIFGHLKQVFHTDETFHETEVQGNRLGTAVMSASGIILGIILILNAAGVFKMDMSVVLGPLVQGIIETAAVTFICILFRFDKRWLKWMLVIVMAVVYARLDGVFTHKAWILMVIPVIFSARYFSRKLTVFTTVITSALFLISALWGSVYGLFDLNIVSLPQGTQMVSEGGYLDQAVLDTGFDRGTLLLDTFLFNYIPKWMIFFVVALISMNIARRGRYMVMRQRERDEENARIESELELARRIQSDMLVTVFPAFTQENGYGLYASMTPAREVGGDFYDFFMIDDTHLGMVIADVSGKGIPAAMFMTKAMTLIKGSAQPGRSPEEILADVNVKLCENNYEEMFVTAWFGILDKTSGRLQAANAGHEYPFFKQSGGDFSLLKDKHGFVLGGMPESEYTGYEIMMEPGACIFVYTDGLPEAESDGHGFFGMDRILDTLNKDSGRTPEDIINDMSKTVKALTEGVPQFDDLTMMCVKYCGRTDTDDTVVVAAEINNAGYVADHINKCLEKRGCPDKVKNQINIAVDEIFSNIAKYAYAPGTGDVAVKTEYDEDKKKICVKFADKGKKYDPLEAEEPDISLSADERTPGGLGVFMVKKLMDEVEYEYRDEQNILKITKCFYDK